MESTVWIMLTTAVESKMQTFYNTILKSRVAWIISCILFVSNDFLLFFLFTQRLREYSLHGLAIHFRYDLFHSKLGHWRQFNLYITYLLLWVLAMVIKDSTAKYVFKIPQCTARIKNSPCPCNNIFNSLLSVTLICTLCLIPLRGP